MKITFRWFGSRDDSVTLDQIKEIPSMNGIVAGVFDIPTEEVWILESVQALKKDVTEKGLNLDVIESVNIHEDIKLGVLTPDKYIENYQETIRNLSKKGVKVICCNFMPIFDWTRTNLSKELPDGFNELAYKRDRIEM